MTVSLDDLYAISFAIDESKDKSKNEGEIAKIISACGGDVKEKKLGSQLLVRYFQHYPQLHDRMLDCLFSLCEDEDVEIRKGVVKDLPSLCKYDNKHVDKIADILTQLLQTEDANEQQVVQKALVDILTKYTKATLTQLFAHIMSSNDEKELIRERAVKFLAVKLKPLAGNSAILTKELQEYVHEEIKKVMQDVTGEEFILLMYVLQNLPILQTVQGRHQLLGQVLEQADIDKPFVPTDPDRVDQICSCFKQAITFLSKNVNSGKMVEFMLENVIPKLDQVPVDGVNPTAKLELVRTLAELSPFAGPIKNANTLLMSLFNATAAALPSLPSQEVGVSDGAKAATPSTEGSQPGTAIDEMNIDFSLLEALLYSLHSLGKHNETFLSSIVKPDMLKTFKARLQYVARVIQLYSTKLQKVLGGLNAEQRRLEENKIKLLALKTTANISLLAKDLLRNPISYNSVASVSWKQTTSTEKTTVSDKSTEKRRISDENGASERTPKAMRSSSDVAYYKPPSGKFSDKAGMFPDESTVAASDNHWKGRGGGFATSTRRGRGRGRRFIRY